MISTEEISTTFAQDAQLMLDLGQRQGKARQAGKAAKGLLANPWGMETRISC